MLDIKFIRENVELVKQAAQAKRITCDVDRLIEVDQRRRELQRTLDKFREQVKESGQRIGLLRNPKSDWYKRAIAEGRSDAEIKAEAARDKAEKAPRKPKIK